MKYLILPALFLITFLFVSCGDDSTTGTTNPPSNTLFSMDTIAAVKDAGTVGLTTITQSFNQTISASEVKVEYRIQSNIDTTNNGCTASYTDTTNGLPASPNTINVYGAVDSAYSFTYNVATQPFYSGFKVKLQVNTPQSVQRYIRFVNVKVTKVN